jgi:membrane associated rhomboid family serine protease
MFGNRPANEPAGDPATRVIIALNVAVFALQYLAGRHWLPVLGRHWLPVLKACALSPTGLRDGALWQLVTYQFLHANELHILMNMVGLWFVGRELEPVVGTGRFVALYLGGGVVAGLAQMLFSPGSGALIGASGSVFAVLLAFTMLFPSLPITALVVFVPVNMRARTLGLLAVTASVVFWISGREPGIGHLAHLGGSLAGWIFGRVYRRRFGFDDGSAASWWPRQWKFFSAPRDVSYLRPLPSEDEVIAKIQREGIGSLTHEELRILEASRRPRRRG